MAHAPSINLLEYFRFSIVNFSKPDSQYNVGMKPVMYSIKEAEKNGVGWQRTGDQIRYFRKLSVIFFNKKLRL